MRLLLCAWLILALCSSDFLRWGFFAHKLINRHAVFSLPPEMIGFYKKHINIIVDNAVNPDKRRYTVKYEAAKHYIDIDHYGDSALFRMPKNWNDAVARYSADTLNKYGVVPWHINLMKYRLTQAFADHNAYQILKLSSEIGHYIADANVPLHTTENYNGQLTNQHGIHGFWESRLPELFSADFDLLVGQVDYIASTQQEAWSAVVNAHLAVDSLLRLELGLSKDFPKTKKYSYEERGSSLVKVYSREFSARYHRSLDGMVEKRMRAAIKMTASFWYTSWVDAGQPDLSLLDDTAVGSLKGNKKDWIKLFESRMHENQ